MNPHPPTPKNFINPILKKTRIKSEENKERDLQIKIAHIDHGKSAKVVAKEFGVDKTRVSQIANRLCMKMNKPLYINNIRGASVSISFLREHFRESE